MATCDKCFAGRHIKCHDMNCGCGICKDRRKLLGVGQKPRKRYGSSNGQSTYVPRTDGNRYKNRVRFGFMSSLEPDVVAEVIEWAKRRESISAAARNFGCTRDQIRSIYEKVPSSEKSEEAASVALIAENKRLGDEIARLRAELTELKGSQ